MRVALRRKRYQAQDGDTKLQSLLQDGERLTLNGSFPMLSLWEKESSQS